MKIPAPAFPPPAAGLAARIVHRARQTPDAIAAVLLDARGQEERMATAADLHEAAAAGADWLERQGVARGASVLVSSHDSMVFLAGFLACLYHGAVAVPLPVPTLRRGGDRLAAVTEDCALAAVFTDASSAGHLGQALAAEGASLPQHTDPWLLPRQDREPVAAAPDALAFLQYTSGSTGTPRGVEITHANLNDNLEVIRAAFQHGPQDIGLGWLPPYHDMGLVGLLLQPLWCGFPVHLLPPLAFVQNPLIWWRTVSRLRATVTGGPCFSFDLSRQAAEEAGAEALADLDLSSLRLLFSGAEPIRASSVRSLLDCFSRHGLRPEAFYACYGMAETTLMVSGPQPGTGLRVHKVDASGLNQGRIVPAGQGRSRELVACGRLRPGFEALIVDPETGAELPPGSVGELLLSGPSIARGYHHQADSTACTFITRPDAARRWLRTGDLCALVDDGAGGQELLVCGRIKEVLVVRGVKHHPQDIEAAAASAHPGLRADGMAAVAVDDGDGEELVVVGELSRQLARDPHLDRLPAAIRAAVAQRCGVTPSRVLLVAAGALPRTTSGKLRRVSLQQRITAAAGDPASDLALKVLA